MLRRIFTGIALALLVAPVGTAQDAHEKLTAYNGGVDATALRGLPPLAVKGDAQAQNKLAFMYLRGENVPQDDAKAVEWFHKAAEQGHTRAQYNLAILYHIGIGVRRNDAQAEKWFSRAAEQGHGAAKISLIFMRENGRHLTTKVPPGPVREDLHVQSVIREIGQDVASRVQSAPVRKDQRVQSATREIGQDVASKVQSAPVREDQRVQAVAREEGRGAVTKVASAPARGDFRVQLGSVKLKARAVAEASRLNRIHKLALGSLKIVPVRANLGKRGIFYRLRTRPLIDHASAKSLCRKLSTRKQGCLVAKR